MRINPNTDAPPNGELWGVCTRRGYTQCERRIFTKGDVDFYEHFVLGKPMVLSIDYFDETTQAHTTKSVHITTPMGFRKWQIVTPSEEEDSEYF